MWADALPIREPTNLLHATDREKILFDFWKAGTAVGRHTRARAKRIKTPLLQFF